VLIPQQCSAAALECDCVLERRAEDAAEQKQQLKHISAEE